MSSPTVRTLALMRKEGWQAAVVEKYVSFTKQRIDLFGVIDVLGCRTATDDNSCWGEILGIQTTTQANSASHVDKCLAEPRLKVWLASGGLFQLWTWRKLGARGKRKLWECQRLYFTLQSNGKIQISREE